MLSQFSVPWIESQGNLRTLPCRQKQTRTYSTKLKRAQTIFVQLMKIRINQKHRKISNMYTAVALIIFVTKIKPTRPKKHHTTRTDVRWSIYNHTIKYAPLPVKFHRFAWALPAKPLERFKISRPCFESMHHILVWCFLFWCFFR